MTSQASQTLRLMVSRSHMPGFSRTQALSGYEEQQVNPRHCFAKIVTQFAFRRRCG